MASLREVKDYCLSKFDDIEHELSLFRDQVKSWFETHPKLVRRKPTVIHSVKHRLKDKAHLVEKIERKLIPDPDSHQIEIEEGWNSEEIFRSLTDLAGVRVLLLHQRQFEPVHVELMKKIGSGDWTLYEAPKAYTWDPDSAAYFERLGIATQVKDSLYTSVHYVIQPKKDSDFSCEIQVRTLFEEIWVEVDHTLNYPAATENIACREQLRVLAKVVGAGSRLVDSIFSSAELTVVAQPQIAVVAGLATQVEDNSAKGLEIATESYNVVIPPTEKPIPVPVSEEDGKEIAPEDTP